MSVLAQTNKEKSAKNNSIALSAIKIEDEILKELNDLRTNPQDYIKQELDWIRSFIPQKEYESYEGLEREGRSIILLEAEKKRVLEGLNGWERKMKDVGVIDYLGLTNEL